MKANRNLDFSFGERGVLSLGTVLTCFDALPRALAIFLMVVGWTCAVAQGFYSWRAKSISKRVGYLFMLVWFIVVGAVTVWGRPAWATPSADDMKLLLELLLFGFAGACGVALLVEIWKRLVRCKPAV